MSEQMLVCPICRKGDLDRIGMSLHFRECEDAHEIASKFYALLRKERNERLKGFKL